VTVGSKGSTGSRHGNAPIWPSKDAAGRLTAERSMALTRDVPYCGHAPQRIVAIGENRQGARSGRSPAWPCRGARRGSARARDEGERSGKSRSRFETRENHDDSSHRTCENTPLRYSDANNRQGDEPGGPPCVVTSATTSCISNLSLLYLQQICSKSRLQVALPRRSPESLSLIGLNSRI